MVNLFSLLKGHQQLSTLEITVHHDSPDQLLPISEYLESNSGAIEFLTLVIDGRPKGWKSQPERLRLLRALNQNTHIRDFRFNSMSAPESVVLENVSSNSVLIDVFVDNYKTSVQIQELLKPNRDKFQEECRRIFLCMLLRLNLKNRIELGKIFEILRMVTRNQCGIQIKG
jgi:hypothetical protein